MLYYKKTKLLLNDYTARSRFETEFDIKMYIAFRFEGYSTSELSEREHVSQTTIYRRIKKVDEFIASMVERER